MKRSIIGFAVAAGFLTLSWGGSSGCGSGAQCGDGVLGGSEVCDGGALNGQTCESQGFSSEGDLACASDCKSFDTSGCVEAGTVSALASVSGDGDDFVTVSSDSAGNRYGAIYSDSTTVTAGGLSLPTIAPVVRRGSLARFGDDGKAAWLKPFQGNGTSDDNGVSLIFDAAGRIVFSGDYRGTQAMLPDRTITNVDVTGATSDTYAGRLEPDATVDWLATFNSNLLDQAFAQFDPSGNLYATGQFAGATVSANGETVTNSGFPGSFDKFIQKIDPVTGAPLWTVHFGSDADDDLFPTFDSAGNVFVSGGFSGFELFVDGVSKLTNASPGSTDAFVGRLDPDTGNLLWITGFSSADFDFARILPDSEGRLFAFGGFQGATLTADTKTLPNAGAASGDGFVAGLDPADGKVDWLKGFASDKSDLISMAADGTGHAYVSGSFLGAAFDAAGRPLTNADASGTTADDFLGRIDPDGTLAWVAHFTGPGFSGGVFGSFTASTDADHIYVDGVFSGASLTVGGRTLTNADAGGTTNDGFIAQFSSEGTLGWLLHFSGTGNDTGFLAADFSSTSPGGSFPTGKIYVTSRFQSPTLSVGGDTFTNVDAAGTTEDAFAARLNPADGSFLWLLPVSSEGDDAVDLTHDAFGHLSLGGRYKGKTVDVDGTVFTNADASGATFDGFAGRIAP
ncbi:MAG TPA: hypothetical protein VFX30_14740 [bacterium]|nr:hypothetical protein [bacterium]